MVDVNVRYEVGYSVRSKQCGIVEWWNGGIMELWNCGLRSSRVET